ncbi:alpha/beta hydrolase [Streptomyces sp. NBC_00083]|uniref:alpha/beta hydrolase n=1 Tax=Streptomyces sp. NBC_00083 TaxID=2975647 RepID=UPI002257F2A3|nr:alpha/beta hydrolase [Streptomyces sp. NBC_00083]MCX5388325.1 alpha/beta hydrolase [Streptomyces sp. NBC_00083]
MAASRTPAPVVSRCAVVLLAGLTLAGCSARGGADGGASTAPGATAAVKKAAAQPGGRTAPVKGDTFGCLTPEQAATDSIVFTSATGSPTGGFLTGRGNTGIVLAHQSGGSVCEWKDRALQLGKDGFRVLAVNSTTGDQAAEIEGAATVLRREGAWKLLLMGASQGGAATLQAAARMPLKPDALVALSAPSAPGPPGTSGTSGPVDARAAAEALAVPVLYLAGGRDGASVTAARELSAAGTKAPENRLVTVAGSDRRGVGLLSAPDTWETVVAFLKKYCT